jgi:hypothetical protein
MRTKTLLLTAALGVASVATSMAQAVYSINVVGYVTLTVRPGFNMIANQLDAGSGATLNSLNSVLPGAPLEAQILTFANNNYTLDVSDGTSWIDGNTGDPSVTKIAPGTGFFYYNPAAAPAPLTFVGEVKTGNGLTVTYPSGFSLKSTITPQELSLSAANGFPQVLEMQYLTFNAATQNYDELLVNDGTGWINGSTGDPADARPAVGQGYFIYNPTGGNLAWTRNFNPNTP